MKRKIITLVLLLSFVASVFAVDYLKYRTNGTYEGYASSEYMGNQFDFGMDYDTAKDFVVKLMDAEYGEDKAIIKLTKNQKYLIETALSDWDISEGDVYIVEWMERESTQHYITIAIYSNTKTYYTKTYFM